MSSSFRSIIVLEGTGCSCIWAGFQDGHIDETDVLIAADGEAFRGEKM